MTADRAPIGLSDKQLDLINRVSGPLPPAARSVFLRRLAQRLGSEPSDNALHEAIRAVLPRRREIHQETTP